MRTPDKPGTYRVKAKRDGWAVSGVTREGQRVRMTRPSEREAREIAATLFGGPTPPPGLPAGTVSGQTVQLDDWGLPVSLPPIAEDTIKAVGQSLGVSVASALTQPVSSIVNPEAQVKARARAKTICEFLGVGVASADVWVARKLTVSVGKEPVNPSAKQVAGLATAWQDAISEVLADKAIGPWTMAILLSLALPASMLLQSPKAKPAVDEQKPEGLRSVV